GMGRRAICVQSTGGTTSRKIAPGRQTDHNGALAARTSPRDGRVNGHLPIEQMGDDAVQQSRKNCSALSSIAAITWSSLIDLPCGEGILILPREMPARTSFDIGPGRCSRAYFAQRLL